MSKDAKQFGLWITGGLPLSGVRLVKVTGLPSRGFPSVYVDHLLKGHPRCY